MREAVPEYRKLIVMRINPFVRRIECDGMDVTQTAHRLVEDYNSRNFVTAGGWAIEALAAAGRPEVHKSGIAGIDIDRFDPTTGEYHLYVLKSGIVTRNSDIIAALKRNARQAEKQLRQSRSTKGVRANYAISAGRTTSSFEDGVWRPSSGEFWGEMLDLPEGDAVELALAIAAEAGRLVRSDAAEHIAALKLLVANYVGQPATPDRRRLGVHRDEEHAEGRGLACRRQGAARPIPRPPEGVWIRHRLKDSEEVTRHQARRSPRPHSRPTSSPDGFAPSLGRRPTHARASPS